ncbi:hypothetical protein NST21_08865 [Peribacillus sp. FSL K6-1552]|uniref:hypothetical protein n=1 Tax=Peribacillus sp. FSL K6-1552 TaxID=2954514 RepID=UPI0030F4D8A1
MDKCTSCGRPLPKDSNKVFCSYCKSKNGNIIGKIGAGLAAVSPVVLLITKKFKK